MSFLHRFGDLRCRHGALDAFHEPSALLDWLHDPGVDPEAKNKALRALVVEAQTPGDTATFAQTVLILGLWPGLDAVRGRLLRHYRHAPDDLAAEIISRATIGIRRMDLIRVNRIAATLVRNVERDIRRGLSSDWQRAAAALGDDGGPKPLDEPDPMMDRIDLDRALGRLSRPDAALIVAVILEGVSQTEAAARFGLGAEAGRKRYQRALARLRETLQPDLSQSAAQDGVSPVMAADRGPGTEQ